MWTTDSAQLPLILAAVVRGVAGASMAWERHDTEPVVVPVKHRRNSLPARYVSTGSLVASRVP